jgi:hypothetical protein
MEIKIPALKCAVCLTDKTPYRDPTIRDADTIIFGFAVCSAHIPYEMDADAAIEQLHADQAEAMVRKYIDGKEV